jgi:hypothetical protein
MIAETDREVMHVVAAVETEIIGLLLEMESGIVELPLAEEREVSGEEIPNADLGIQSEPRIGL